MTKSIASGGDLFNNLYRSFGTRSLPPDLHHCIAAEAFAKANAPSFQSARPFPHVTIDAFLTDQFCQQLVEEFPAFHPKYATDENGAIGGKATHNNIRNIGPAYRKLDKLIQTRTFLDLMSATTGIPDLLYDPDYVGGGTHENMDGQSLDFHIDFNYLESNGWHRRINLILFLNEQWEDTWGGCLALREDPLLPDSIQFKPQINRAVIFETNEISWHGFSKITLPDNVEVSRKTIALYFYTKSRPTEQKPPPRSTLYIDEALQEHLVEGYQLNANDMADLRSLIDRRDLHITRLYEHERHLISKVSELEDKSNPEQTAPGNSMIGMIRFALGTLRYKLLKSFRSAKQEDHTRVMMNANWQWHGLTCGWIANRYNAFSQRSLSQIYCLFARFQLQKDTGKDRKAPTAP